MNRIMEMLESIRDQQKNSSRRRNALLAWMLAWSILATGAAGAGAYVWYDSTRPPAPEPAEPPPAYQLAEPPSCRTVGNWIVTSYNEDNDGAAYSLGDTLIDFAPDGMRDYELTCIVSLNRSGSFDQQVIGCSDRNGYQARSGGGLGSSRIDDALTCLAILRGNYIGESWG